MIALWDLLGGFAGIARIAIGATFAAVIGWLFVIPAERAEARSGYVLEVRAISAEAQRDELQRQYNAGQIVISAYQVQLKNARAKQAVEDAEDEQRISAYEQKLSAAGRSCALDDADLDFLR